MGETAARKVTEIEETRRRIEADIRELESCVPAPFRSTKSLAGVILGSTALTALLLRRSRSERSNGHPSVEVVVRIVRDDLAGS